MPRLSCLLLVLAFPSGADAQDAAALIEEGVVLREQGNDEAALAKFEAAYAVDESAHALGQIALAEQALGRWIDAEAHLREALEDQADPWVRRNRRPLEDALRAIGQRLATVELEANVEVGEVYVNGELRHRLPLSAPLRVVAGDAMIEIRAEGYLPMRRTVTTRGGQRAREIMRLTPLPGAAGHDPDGTGSGSGSSLDLGDNDGTASAEESGGSVFSSPLFWVIVGAVVVGAATVTAVLLLSGNDGQDFADSDVGGVVFTLEGS
ncbi:MAG: tetratricopeptide repeat protein [Myxococcota bacterium]